MLCQCIYTFFVHKHPRDDNHGLCNWAETKGHAHAHAHAHAHTHTHLHCDQPQFLWNLFHHFPPPPHPPKPKRTTLNFLYISLRMLSTMLDRHQYLCCVCLSVCIIQYNTIQYNKSCIR